MAPRTDDAGPFDLSKQMGVERGGKEHEDAIQRTLKACKDNGKVAAIFCTPHAFTGVDPQLTEQARTAMTRVAGSSRASAWSLSSRTKRC